MIGNTAGKTSVHEVMPATASCATFTCYSVVSQCARISNDRFTANCLLSVSGNFL